MRTHPYLRCVGRLGLLPLICLALRSVDADSAIWNLDPVTGDWNTAANWSPATVPNGPGDTATFGLSHLTVISVDQTIITLDSIVFNPTTSVFTIRVGPDAGSSLVIVGSGITNNSGVTQNFATISSADNGEFGTIEFHNGAIAGSGLVFTNHAGVNLDPPGITKFWDTSSAGDATFVNLGGHTEGTIEFHDDSTAGNATFDNGASGEDRSGLIVFSENATAGNGYFNNEGNFQSIGGVIEFDDNSTAGTATFVNRRGIVSDGASIMLLGNASADHGTFIVEGADSRGFHNAQITFLANSTAGDATITLESALKDRNPGGSLLFLESSSAGNSTLIAENGPGSDGGGVISFQGTSSGGTARVELLGPTGLGTLEMDQHLGSDEVTVGSIEGSGLVIVGSRNGAHTLIIGSNNLSATFSGVIQDGDEPGSIIKIGTGTLTLTGANTYNGGTTITSGILLVSNIGGSGTGTGAVNANAGTVGGSGIISGAVTVGTNTGVQAFLAPSKGAKKPGTLTIQSVLTLNDDSTYIYQLNTKRAVSDEVIANGVVIDSGAKFSLRPSGTNALTVGQVFTVISNTSGNPIVGTFHNLADGQIISVNGSNLQASYTGGDGNDLTLTVVP